MLFQTVVEQARRVFRETGWQILPVCTEDNACEVLLFKGVEDAVLTRRAGGLEWVEIVWLAELPEPLVNRTDWKPLLSAEDESAGRHADPTTGRG